MSASTLAGAGRPSLTIRGTCYPVLLPSLRDPRLHLAAVIISLQVLGQTAFDFNLSIAQILIAIGTCAVLEVGISFFREQVLLWPASALLTGNGVAFILRVPGTEHGDWWSLHGAWIFAGTAAVALLSKYVIRWRGRHVFNPSNFGLVVCFLALGKFRAEPLDFWWGPMSPWMVLALILIVGGGLAILTRLRLLAIAVGFWLAFAAGIGILAASGHYMLARWHLGPISGWEFWWLLVTSPEILIFLFFMITDPKTIPRGRGARLAYAIGVGLLATLLIAPQTTEFATKVAVLAALALMCAARPLLEHALPAEGSADGLLARWAARPLSHGRLAAGGVALAAAAAFAGLAVVAGIPARPTAAEAVPAAGVGRLPQITVATGAGVSPNIDRETVEHIARDLVADLRDEEEALRLRDARRASNGAGGAWLVDLRRQVQRSTEGEVVVATHDVEHIRLTPRIGIDQGPPTVSAVLRGTVRPAVYRGSPPRLVRQLAPTAFTRSVDAALDGDRYVIIRSGGTASEPAAPSLTPAAPVAESPRVPATGALADVRLEDVAAQVGLDFRQGAFRFGPSNDVPAMMGGGLCWLDYDNDGWLDLFVVNSWSDADFAQWDQRGGLPRSALFRNRGGRFSDVSHRAHADLAVRGQGCVAADLNGDGLTDLYVTTASYDKLLWNDGDGTFTEGAAAAGIRSFGWHAGAAVTDVNGDGRPDLFVAGYTDLNAPNPTATGGFPTTFLGVRDLLYLNEGADDGGRPRFREVGLQAGLESARFSHGLGAVFTDFNGDGRPDLYVANDEDPNQLYENVPWPGGVAADPAGLGFRLDERAASEGVADPYAGMGVAAGDYDEDGRTDLFVTNSRREPHAAYRRRAGERAPAYADARAAFTSALGRASSTGWGASWVDLALDGRPDLVLANGTVPITSLAKNAGRVQLLQSRGAARQGRRFANVGGLGLGRIPSVNGRGLAVADYDNNGTQDIAVSSVGGPLLLLRSSGRAGHWLEVRLARFVPGAVVTVVLPDGRRLVRELRAGGSYLSSEDPRAHFGLGDATRVRSVSVRYPGGKEARLSGVAADRIVVLGPPTPAAGVTPSEPPASPLRPDCTRAPLRGRSVARVWNEAALATDRLSASAPTTTARNLFHLSAAMWDAWAAYDPKADGYFVTEKPRSSDVQAARETAMSYAAYRLLVWRAGLGANVRQAFSRLTSTMRSLCYRPDYTGTAGDAPAALGNRIAAAAIAYGRNDGALERERYADPSYTPVNEPLVVSEAGGSLHDPTFWQPLAFGQITISGGLPVPTKVQTFAGAQWGRVRGFALPASRRGLPVDPGPPPLGDPASQTYKRAAVEVIRLGNRPAEIPARGGPGRWNAIANAVADAGPGSRRLGAAQRLARDVRLYLALNGALHDAAVAAWGAKRSYQSARPISMVRYMAFQGQSSDRRSPAYNREGLPLVPGLIEVITPASTAPGQRHAGLARHVGDVAVRTPRSWVLGTRWLPAVVTPPYPGWVSDESAFARAAAEILSAETGSSVPPAGSELIRWRTYRLAADQAGLAGVAAGTQIAADDVAGRRIGSRVGKQAWQLAERYFAGTAR